MEYITMPCEDKYPQMSLEDIWFDLKPKGNVLLSNTRTWCCTPSEKIINSVDFNKISRRFKEFNERFGDVIEADRRTQYKSFPIPKHSGGLRQIDAPNDDLMTAQRALGDIIKDSMFATHHTNAFAYIKRRCPADAVRRHQENGSRWILKLDFSNFFGSTTPEFVISQLKQIFPFSRLDDHGWRDLQIALSVCFFNGGLPQGTPISPMLTNIMMIPIDYAISNYCRNRSPHLVYTRYADDIHISCKYDFDWREVKSKIVEITNSFSAPFFLNEKKVRYGNTNGANWMLGTMLNKDNQITIGHKKKKQLKAMIYSFMQDSINGDKWSLNDLQTLLGLISYYRSIEKNNIDKIIGAYSQRFNASVIDTLKKQMVA